MWFKSWAEQEICSHTIINFYCGGVGQWQKHFSTSSICDLKWFGTGKTWLYPRGWADGYSWTSGGQNSYLMGSIRRPRTVGRCLRRLNIIKCFTIQPKPSHFQILTAMPTRHFYEAWAHQTDRKRKTFVHEEAFIKHDSDDNRLELSNLKIYFHFINEMKYIYCIQRLYCQGVFLARFLCEACLVCHARVQDQLEVPGLGTPAGSAPDSPCTTGTCSQSSLNSTTLL